MALNVIHDLAPEIASGVVVEVSGHVLGRSLIDGLRKNFFPSSQVEQGDHYMDRSRELLQGHLELIQLDEQNTIRDYYDDARDLRERLDNPNGSIVQRFVQARKYRHKSRKTYKIVKRASDRAVDGRLMDQIADATHANGPGVGSGFVCLVAFLASVGSRF